MWQRLSQNGQGFSAGECGDAWALSFGQAFSPGRKDPVQDNAPLHAQEWIAYGNRLVVPCDSDRRGTAQRGIGCTALPVDACVLGLSQHPVWARRGMGCPLGAGGHVRDGVRVRGHLGRCECQLFSAAGLSQDEGGKSGGAACADGNASAQVGKLEGVDAIAAIRRAKYRKQGGVLVDGKGLTRRWSRVAGAEVAAEQKELSYVGFRRGMGRRNEGVEKAKASARAVLRRKGVEDRGMAKSCGSVHKGCINGRA